MAIISRGFTGRRSAGPALPPGQYLVEDFPVLTAGPTPKVSMDAWEFTVTAEDGTVRRWSWVELMALPAERPHVDLHCVTSWSKLGTDWRGVSLDVLLDGIDTAAAYASVTAYGGYTTNLPLADLRDGRAWLAFEFDGRPLAAEHGGPARLLVPHLYLWKSAKWARGIELLVEDRPGFWERAGYHSYGDPWREQRYQGD